MKGVIKFEKNKLIYFNDKKKYSSAYFKTKNFDIAIADIAIIGVYYSLLIDDQLDMLVFVDKTGDKYFIPIAYDIEGESYLKLLHFFKIKNDFVTVDWKEYEKNNSYVLWPIKLKGEKLYRNNGFLTRVITGIFKIFKIRKIGEGELTEENKIYCKNILSGNTNHRQ